MTHEELREAVAQALEAADQTLRPRTEWRLAMADAALATVREALPGETRLDEAPLGLSNAEAGAWADGWNAAVVTWRAMLGASALGGPGHD